MTKTQAQSVALAERAPGLDTEPLKAQGYMSEADKIVLRHELFEPDADAECTQIPEILSLGLALDYQCRLDTAGFEPCGHRVPIDPGNPNEAWAEMWFHVAGHGSSYLAESWTGNPKLVRITDRVSPVQPTS